MHIQAGEALENTGSQTLAVKTDSSAPPPKFVLLWVWDGHARICISNMFSEDIDAADLATIF